MTNSSLYNQEAEMPVEMFKLAKGEANGSIQEGLIPIKLVSSFLLLSVFILMSHGPRCKACGTVPETHTFFDLECRDQTLVTIASVQLESAFCGTSDP